MAKTLGSLALGAKIKFGKHQVNNETPWDIIWTVVAKNHSCTPAYPSNSVTLHSTNVIDLRCFDAKEPSNTQNDTYAYAGNSRYSLSNIHQWLNSTAGAGAWYSAKHTYDQSPDSSNVVDHGTAYASRPGFFKNFTSAEWASILSTTVKVLKNAADGGSSETVTAKVFLPSTTEVGAEASSEPEGTTWAYYSNGGSRVSNLLQAVYLNSSCTEMGLIMCTNGAPWWTRTHGGGSIRYVSAAGDTNNTKYARTGSIGVRPALNLSYTTSVSDTTDSDGCYTILYNSPPNAPSTISVSGTPRGGGSLKITWGKGSDVDGNLAGYILYRSYDGGAAQEVTRTSSTSYTDTIAAGKTTVLYTVRSYDSRGSVSGGAATTGELTVLNNAAPTVSSSDPTNLGVKSEGFTLNYSVADANNDSVTVVEKLDGVVLKTYTVTGGNKSSSISIGGEEWLKMSNGSHTITITATDVYGDAGSKTFNFTKSVTKLSVKNSTPYDADVMPTRIRLDISREVADGAIFKVYVCNNGYDNFPTWEDATLAVEGNRVYSFTNLIKSAATWGVMVKVEIDRGSASGVSYVSQIGGNFE